MPAIFIGVLTLALAVMLAELTPLTIGILALEIPLVLLFAYLMKAPTLAGRKVMDRIAGFEMYLSVAEAEDLQRIESIAGSSPVRTP